MQVKGSKTWKEPLKVDFHYHDVTIGLKTFKNIYWNHFESNPYALQGSGLHHKRMGRRLESEREVFYLHSRQIQSNHKPNPLPKYMHFSSFFSLWVSSYHYYCEFSTWTQNQIRFHKNTFQNLPPFFNIPQICRFWRYPKRIVLKHPLHFICLHKLSS